MRHELFAIVLSLMVAVPAAAQAPPEEPETSASKEPYQVSPADLGTVVPAQFRRNGDKQKADLPVIWMERPHKDIVWFVSYEVVSSDPIIYRCEVDDSKVRSQAELQDKSLCLMYKRGAGAQALIERVEKLKRVHQVGR